MDDQSFTTAFRVTATPDEVFAAINDVRGWWSGEITGDTDHLGAEFTYRYQDMHRSTQRITEFAPGERVVWLVVDSYLSFIEDHAEWNGSHIAFDIAQAGGDTRLTFTHEGLTPDVACYDNCAPAWEFYIAQSLRKFISTGVGAPNETENA
jgi:Activator of Hsp90 ATPase homolog 1-like protein